MKFQAVIFDLDGVICYTDEYHYRAWKILADELDIPFDRSVNNRLRGVSRMESLEIILEKYTGPALGEEEKLRLAAKKNDLYRDSLKDMNPTDLSAEVKETLDAIRQKGYQMAIGSSSKNTPFILRQIGLDGYFDAISDGNNITNSKPDPEVFLKAADMLRIDPAVCLVVEDAVSGAEAAHRGGMKAACVGDAFQKRAGDYNLSSLRELLSILDADEAKPE